MDNTQDNYWRKCSVCKKGINLNSKYYICSVSTCNGQRTGYVFCSIQCFETHLPGANHRSAGAIEKIAPKVKEIESATESSELSSSKPVTQASSSISGNRIIVRQTNGSSSNISSTSEKAGAAPKEVLIIASRLKEYISDKSEFNTSGSVMDVLSDHIRIVCDRAIENARADGRKTVMDRDFDFLKK